MPSLKEYQRKRNFKKTPEPRPQPASSPTGRQYLIHKHDASRLHYDLRLEHDGVLLSWAVPKGPSLVAGEKRLAVHVEDHPLEYGSFEGTIPEDQYGGGTVMLWDRGEWEPLKDPTQGLQHGHLEFRLHGEKLQGAWLLTRMGKPDGSGKENWLLIKRHDETARAPDDPDVLEEAPLSVATGRSLSEIASSPSDVWDSSEPVGRTARTRRQREKSSTKAAELKAPRAKPSPSSVLRSRKAAFPTHLRPQLATLVKEPPPGDEWLHEIKFDGYRLLCMIEDGKVRLITRNGNDWTRKFPAIRRAVARLGVKRAVFDGEIVALNQAGVSDFQALQGAISGTPHELVYYVFDLPWCEGYDLSRSPLIERKRLLHDILISSGIGPEIRYSDHIRGNGRSVLENACRLGMEGIVCKRADSPYEGKRSSHWLKIKCGRRQEFVVCGYTRPAGSRQGFGALLLGYYDDGRLVYCGRVGTGFDEKLLRDLHRRMSAMRVDKPPVINPSPGSAGRNVSWIRPELVAEVGFTEWTTDGVLRHPTFQGLRTDKPARQVIREAPSLPNTPSHSERRGLTPPTPSHKEKRSGRTNVSARSNSNFTVAGVRLTNPDRVLYPEQGITKLQLARFYESIADWILPHVVNRPLAIVRCPRGRSEKCFFQKHVTESLPESIKGLSIRESSGTQQTVMIEDLAGLVGLVQIGALEIHLWGSRADDVEKPDRLVFDLDPGPDVAWEQVNEAALRVRDVLDDIGLVSFVKTSGGKGLHVVAPVTRRHGWDETKAATEAVAQTISRAEPGKYVANMAKSKRHGRIFIDYLRNGRGATSVAPYSTRARHGAPVSTPIAWNELSPKLAADAFRVDNLPARLDKLKKDPWIDFFTIRQSLTAKAMRKLGVKL